MNPFMLLAITFDVLENSLGVGIGRVFGVDIILVGLFAVVVMMAFFIKIGAGIETSIILGVFLIIALSRGIGGATAHVVGFLPDYWTMGIIILSGLLFYLVFLKRES